jgi:uncharacterized protein
MSRIAAITLILVCCGMAGAGDDTYTAEIEKWRQDFEADVRSGGWLTLIGRVKLEGTLWTLGSDPRSTIPLPSQAPAQLGVLYRQALQVRFEPASETGATVDDKPVTAAVELSMKPGSGKIRTRGLELHVRLVGGDPYLFIVDPNNAAVSDFKGTSWYAINPAFRVFASFDPYPQTQLVSVPMTHVESREAFQSTGDVVFHFAGRRFRLKTFIDEDQLFVMFLDATNGRGSYGGGRFLHAPLPKDGRTVLDFNKAFNPYCSLNPNVMCPITPPGNRLGFKVTAGERFADRKHAE